MEEKEIDQAEINRENVEPKKKDERGVKAFVITMVGIAI